MKTKLAINLQLLFYCLLFSVLLCKAQSAYHTQKGDISKFDTLTIYSRSEFFIELITVYLDGVLVDQTLVSENFRWLSVNTVCYRKEILIPKDRKVKITICYAEFNFAKYPYVWFPYVDLNKDLNLYFCDFICSEFTVQSDKGDHLRFYLDEGESSIPLRVNTKVLIPRKRKIYKAVQNFKDIYINE